MIPESPDIESSMGDKPITLRSALDLATLRVAVLCEICQQLLEEDDNMRHSQLLSKLAIVVNYRG